MHFPRPTLIGYGYWNDELSLRGGPPRIEAEPPYENELGEQGSCGWNIRLCTTFKDFEKTGS